MHDKTASHDGSPRSKVPPFSGLDGVLGYCVGDIAGNIVDDHLTGDQGATAITVGAIMSHCFGEIGNRLGLGDVTMITARGEAGSWLVAFMHGHSIAVHLDANVSPTNLEAAVRRGEWLPKSEWEVADSEIQYVPPPIQGTANVPALSTAPATVSKPADPPAAPTLSTARSKAATPPVPTTFSTTQSKPAAIPIVPPLSTAATLSKSAAAAAAATPQATSSSAASSSAASPHSSMASPLTDPMRAGADARTDISTHPVIVIQSTVPNPRGATASTSGMHPAIAPSVIPSLTGPTHTSKPPAPRRQPGSSAPIPGPVVPVRDAVPVRDKGVQLALANARGLRRAFARGDLKEARAIAEHLKHASPSQVDPCGSGKSAEVIEPLLSGIASTLFGDNKSGLEHLIALTERSDIGPSLTWIALVWCGRTSIASADGLDQALTWAEAAGRLSKQLDVEARIVSARLIAEVCLYRADLEHAEKFVEQARRLSESAADRDESGELSLLQAKILLASGKRQQAVASAERAHVYRQHWVAPVVFLCRCAFGDADLERVKSLIAPFDKHDDAPTEVSQIARLLDCVRGADVPTTTAAEFLELNEAPPSSSCIRRLEALGDAYPRLELIRDRLGWKLLKAGRYARASEVFEKLSQRHDLPDHVRSSVLLALGYLAAKRARNVSAGAKVRASVDAAPRHLQSLKSPTNSSGRMRVAPIVDIAHFEPPPLSAANPQLGGDPSATQQFRSASPVFTGNLIHFCLPDVLEFLRAGRRTGTLLCSSVRGIGAVHLRNGFISGAAAPSTTSLRDVLITGGKLTAETAEKAAELQKQRLPHLPIGAILVNEGWLSTEDVVASLRTQSYAAIAELLQWGDGQFAFDPEAGEGAPESQVEIALDPQAVLLDIFKGIDEQAHNVR